MLPSGTNGNLPETIIALEKFIDLYCMVHLIFWVQKHFWK